MSEIRVRASSWGSLFDCAYRWEGEHILGMRKASGLRAQLGTAVHAGTAAFDQATLSGTPISIDAAAGVFVETLHNPEQDVDYKQDDLTVRDGETIGLKLLARYCSIIAPSMDYQSVEMALEPLVIDCGGDILVRLTGTMDRARVARVDGRKIIPDIKTGARVIANGVVSTQGRAAQLGAYQLMSENTDGEPTDGAQIIGLQTTAAANVGVSRIFDAKRVMVGTDTEKGLIEYAAVMFQTGLFPPNPQSQLCSSKYCARWSKCMYHE
ncbi:PD-(D/E)XK nuclease family protein [Herbaspirillum chlorophenolicum]|uniref:PD-(D/E)XK nuclease family protein n=1 Tax=Herbaspirillum chlorophenolicum TaxID=211589 RepID=UPI00067DB0A4|nr:PD-(D/E)XK nuclease family protein [Herbaspirillum chlorophenolicum]